ncbi:MAG: flagellar hook-basal body complex protein [Oscillospiraceae bacterium]|jgi:flagellar basal-body rod protein FlgG|nr:flagellar hook-basal body complex protein [Oscillospiraceae bacterium]
MTRGFYIAGTGMMLQRRRMESITNNIVNADTVGFKRDNLVSHRFDQVMIERRNDYVDRTQYSRDIEVGELTFGTRVDRVYTDFSMGNVEETGKTTDLLAVGDGYFIVETGDGDRYTKAGAFTINSLGYLTDGVGHYVLGTEGRIFVGSDQFQVTEPGEIYVGGEPVNRLRMAVFSDDADPRKQGDNLFYLNAGTADEDNTLTTTIKQGFYENSNVDVGREMVDMMTVYRAYETNQKMVQTVDQMNQKAASQIGRLGG